MVPGPMTFRARSWTASSMARCEGTDPIHARGGGGGIFHHWPAESFVDSHPARMAEKGCCLPQEAQPLLST